MYLHKIQRSNISFIDTALLPVSIRWPVILPVRVRAMYVDDATTE